MSELLMSRQLDTVQTQEKLNDVYSFSGANEPGGASHHYVVVKAGTDYEDPTNTVGIVKFQKGPRKEEGSVSGVLDCDLLEMVKDRLEGFQRGPYASEYNEQALIHIKEALYWMNKRVEDRIARNVLGTTEK